MKSFLITLLFFCSAMVVYSQSLDKVPGYKSPFSNNATSRSTAGVQAGTQHSKNATPATVTSYRSDMSVMSVIPTLKLWLLPAAVPNPFMKEED